MGAWQAVAGKAFSYEGFIGRGGWYDWGQQELSATEPTIK